jgi:hypothetical protein
MNLVSTSVLTTLPASVHSHYFDSEEWTEAGRVVRTEVETRFMAEIQEQWDEIWTTRKHKYLSDVNYVPDDMD